MLRRFLLLTFLALPLALHAQAQTPCTTALADGRNAYDDARFDDAARVLERCVAQLSTDDQSTAYRLIALSHLGSGNTEAARAAIRNLLRVAPGYRTDPATDPPPFTRMVQDVRAAGPAPSTTVRASAPLGVGASNTQGLMAQLGVGYTALTETLNDESDTSTGGGGALLLGYGLTPGIAVFAQLSGSSVSPDEGDSFTYTEVGLGARFTFGTSASKLRPYVQASAVQQESSGEAEDGSGGTVDVAFTGVAGRVGGGVLYFFSPLLAVHGQVNASLGSFSEVTVEGESRKLEDLPFFGQNIASTGFHVSVGITAFPFR